MGINRTFDRLRSALRHQAPELARALGGPLGGAAAEVIAQVLLGRREDDEDALIAAIGAASPEELVKLRLASLDFQARLLDAALEEQRLALSDRADARDRQKALKDRVPGALAFVVVAGFFAVLAVMLVVEVPTEAETEFSIMLGALATMAAAVMNYYFGSSAGSREKTQLLDKRPNLFGRFTDGGPRP